MRHFVTSLTLFVSILIIGLMMCALTCSAKMTAFLINREAGIAVSRGTSGIYETEKSVKAALKEEADLCADESFEKLTYIIYSQGISITEEEASIIYKKGFYNNLKDKCGSGDEKLKEYLSSKVPEISAGKLSIGDDIPMFILDGNKVVLRDVPVEYDYKGIYKRSDSFDVEITIPEMILYDGNDELFSYSMIAKKGIYITGKTSTIFGNIYAGCHGPSEMRSAEALYGEKNRYGGLNVMSTQVAFESDKIISEGDINLRGSFVLFGNEQKPVDIFAKEITETDNVASRNVYSLVGDFNEVPDEPDERDMIDKATEMFDEISYYYDSNNDKAYVGKYRKILSLTDVTVKSDVYGIIMTPRSVIIEEGVNVEGLIISGDRIYVQGNNNIVSSPDVLRNILKEEINGQGYIDVSTGNPEIDEMSLVHLDIVDYLGGIEFRGVKK